MQTENDKHIIRTIKSCARFKTIEQSAKMGLLSADIVHALISHEILMFIENDLRFADRKNQQRTIDFNTAEIRRYFMEDYFKFWKE